MADNSFSSISFAAFSKSDGALMLHGSKNKSNEMYREKIESLYYRAAQSEDATIREQAQACLISKLMGWLHKAENVQHRNYIPTNQILEPPAYRKSMK